MPDLANTATTLSSNKFGNLIGRLFNNLSGWQRGLMAFSNGVFASLALPPAGFWPAIFVAFPVLVLLLDAIDEQANRPALKFRAAFASGWWFGFGYFVISLYWIGAAFLVEADKFAVLLPLAVAVLPAGLAIFWGLATGLSIFAWKPGITRVLILALALTAFEWLRGHILTGFPWNTIGYISASMTGIDQLAAFIGLYGVSFFVLICSLAPALVFSRQPHYAMAAVLLVIFAGGWFAGSQRALTDNRSASVAQPVKQPVIRVVQPNIDQKNKWDRAFQQENIEKYFQMTRAHFPESGNTLANSNTLTSSNTLAATKRNNNNLAAVDIVVWPESALPALFDENPHLQARVADLLPKNTFLVMGALRREKKPARKGKSRRFFNSIMAVNSDGQTMATYDKFHLVPFGEYLPAEKWLAPLGLRKIVAIPASFSTGPGPQSLKVGKLPAFSPLICYEISFSNNIVDHANRPDWIVNVTNDGWFGKTAGPHQHLTQTRLRAIEQGLPIIRAANTGISAMIDPYGRILKSLALGSAGVFDARLPKPIPPTLYARYGDLAAIVLIMAMVIVLASLSGLLAIYQKTKNTRI